MEKAGGRIVEIRTTTRVLYTFYKFDAQRTMHHDVFL